MGILKKGYCLALPRLSGINVNGCTYEHGISPGFLVNLGFLILESCLLLFADCVSLKYQGFPFLFLIEYNDIELLKKNP